MESYMSDLRGDGLAQAHRALESLENNPQLLAQARVRFSQSPPRCPSPSSLPSTLPPSIPSTRFDSPEPTHDQTDREDRVAERYFTRARPQFDAQIREEARKLYEADPNIPHGGIILGALYEKPARERVVETWKRHGIWREEWATVKAWNWGPDPATRPIHQFLCQLLDESERLDYKSAPEAFTLAYEKTLEKWRKRMIWNSKWGVLPGWTWGCEEDDEDDDDDFLEKSQKKPLLQDNSRDSMDQMNAAPNSASRSDRGAEREYLSSTPSPGKSHPHSLWEISGPGLFSNTIRTRLDEVQKGMQPPNLFTSRAMLRSAAKPHGISKWQTRSSTAKAKARRKKRLAMSG